MGAAITDIGIVYIADTGKGVPKYAKRHFVNYRQYKFPESTLENSIYNYLYFRSRIMISYYRRRKHILMIANL